MMGSFCLMILSLPFVVATKAGDPRELFKVEGDLNLALITSTNCNGSSSSSRRQSLIRSAVWTAKRLNFLEFVPHLTLGVSVYGVCDEKEAFSTIFGLFRKREETFFAGLIGDFDFGPKIQKFCEALDVHVEEVFECPVPLVKASVALLNALRWFQKVSVVASKEFIIDEFLKLTRKESICVEDYSVYDATTPIKNFVTERTVIFGNHTQLSTLLQNPNISGVILVPLDASQHDLPERSYGIYSSRVVPSNREQMTNYTLNPSVFQVAVPMVAYAQKLRSFVSENCNETTYKLNCLRQKFRGSPKIFLGPSDVTELLKMDGQGCNYYIYKSDNLSGSPIKIMSYNSFFDNLTMLDSASELDNTSVSRRCDGSCQRMCKNFRTRTPTDFGYADIRIRTESWVFAFLSISLLGVLFCIAILIFLLVAICRRSVLEGNPILTILLLLVTMLMYCSILPLSLEGDKSTKEAICLAKAMSITLSFSAAFSLILSRCILLATASKDIGFMSHVAGPVQSFLCLFIFGVQAALTLQVMGRCEKMFKGHSFVYLLSYNSMLLLLLLCLCPLIYKCQRNYKEGKYFTWTAVLVVLLWCCWVPIYAIAGDDFKDPLLCFGVVSTASAFMVAIFVPRTYLMTIAAAKDKITNTMPSLAPSISAMEIYRSGVQPVYDCVNVAAINAITVARAGLTTLQQPDLYSCPTLPDDDDYTVRCDSPINNDKTTRF